MRINREKHHDLPAAFGRQVGRLRRSLGGPHWRVWGALGAAPGTSIESRSSIGLEPLPGRSIGSPRGAERLSTPNGQGVTRPAQTHVGVEPCSGRRELDF